jgi:hypothetical protein
VTLRVDAKSYFRETEPAVRHMFAALLEYDSVTVPPSLGTYADSSGVIRLNRAQAEQYMRALTESLGLEVAKATLCGSIAQVAYMAINHFSHNAAVDPKCGVFAVTQRSKAAKCCVGRHLHGIPLGLLIYAARVQYNHWDEGMPNNPVPRAVFDALYRHYANDLSFDLAYNLDWPAPRPVAHYVVRHELRWRTMKLRGVSCVST